MVKQNNKISNLEELIQKKHELQTFCTYQEKLITYKFGEIKRDIPEILANEFLPYSPERNTDISSILNMANDFILRFLPDRYRKNKIAEVVLKLMEVLIIRGFGNRGKVKGEKVNNE
jgi:hypothetical protein